MGPHASKLLIVHPEVKLSSTNTMSTSSFAAVHPHTNPQDGSSGTSSSEPPKSAYNQEGNPKSLSSQISATIAQFDVLEDNVRMFWKELKKCTLERDSLRRDLKLKDKLLAELRKDLESSAVAKQAEIADLTLQIKRLGEESKRATTIFETRLAAFEIQVTSQRSLLVEKEKAANCQILTLREELAETYKRIRELRLQKDESHALTIKIQEELKKAKDDAWIRALEEEANIAAPNFKDDCPYFYRPEGCLIGERCPLRHCEAAKDSLEACPRWVQGECDERILLCPRRHMPQQRINEERVKFYPEGANGGGGGDQLATEEAEPQKDKALKPEVDDQKGKECPICFEDDPSTKWMSLVCGHMLCEGCSKKYWGKKGRRTCPICKAETRYKPKQIFFN